MGNTFTDTYGGNTFTGTHGTSSGNTFTQAYGSSVPSGGGGPVHHASSGESTFLGGIFGGVAHAVEHIVHPVEAPLHFYNNKILQPASNLAGGFALGLGELGKVIGEDTYNTWRHPHLHPTKENSHFYNDIVVPQAHDVSNKFSPIVENPQKGSSYDAVRKDPFGTALDLLALGTIPFGAEGAALKGATLADRAGMADTALGRGLARAAVRANEARKPYDVAYAPNEAEGGVFKADRARTFQGRHVYNPVREAVGKAFKGQIPFIGNAARFSRYAHQMTSIELGPDYALLRSFDTAIGAHVRSAKRLTKAERVTLDIIPGYGPDTARAAELGVPRKQLLTFYQRKLDLTKQALRREDLGRGARVAAHTEQRTITGKIRLLTRHAKEIDEAIKNPRPILQQVTEQARGVADSIGNWMIDAHLAMPETIAERPYLEQKLLSDATYSKGETLGYTQAQPDYAEKRAAYDAAQAEHDALASQVEAPVNAWGEPIVSTPRNALDDRAIALINDARSRPPYKLNLEGDIGAQLGELTGGGSFTSREWADYAQNELEKFYETRAQLAEQIKKEGRGSPEAMRLDRELKQRTTSLDQIFSEVDPQYAKMVRDLHEGITKPTSVPKPVAAEGKPSFLMDVNTTFYREHVARGGGGIVTRPSFFTRGGVQLTRVRLTEEQLAHLEWDARHENSSSARAALRRIEAQRSVVHEAVDKARRKLKFTKDKTTGGLHVEGTQYHIQQDPASLGYIAFHGSDALPGGIYPHLADAKVAVEKDAQLKRSEALQAERQAATAAGPHDPFMEALGEYDQAITAQDTLQTKDHVTPDQLAAAKQRVEVAAENLRHARTQPGRRVPIQQEPGFYGGNINFDEIRLEHPDAFYRPHSGPTPAGKGQYEPAGGSGVGAPKRPGETRLNTGHRFSTGQMESGPQVWTRAGLHVLRFRAIRDTLERYRPIMVPYDGVGGSAPLREGYGPVNIQFTKDGIKPASISRGQKESAALDENLLSLTPAQEQQRLTTELNNLFPAEHTHLQVATFQMPLKDIKKIKGDYKRSNIVVRNLVDKPLAVWKALVLKNRPAWLINNLFGQHALLLLHNGLQWQNYVAALSPKRRQELNDAIPGLLMQGTSNLAAGSARISERQGRMLAGYYGRSARGAALAGHGAAKVFNVWGDGISKFNQELADNVPRTALAIKYVKEQQQAMRHLEIAHGAVTSAVKGKTITEAAHLLTQDQKAEILRKTNRYLGDFGSMSGASARNVRRVLPFATWFKVIMQITTDLTLDHPEKLLFLQALERAGKRDRSLAPNMKLLPSWYQGSLLAPIVAGPSAAGTQPLLSTTAINPFMTPVQLTQQVSSFFKTGQPGASDNPVSSLGPIAEAVLLAENVDPFFGGAYTGPGQKQSPLVRAAAGTLFGLPEMRLLQQGGVAPYYRPPASYKDTYVNVGGHQVPLDALLRYFGYPLRRVDKAKAQGYAKEGR